MRSEERMRLCDPTALRLPASTATRRLTLFAFAFAVASVIVDEVPIVAADDNMAGRDDGVARGSSSCAFAADGA